MISSIKTLFALGVILVSTASFAQRPSVASIQNDMNSINTTTVNNKTMIISYRGLSRFMGAKVASYLSDGGDLSLFKNYTVLNTEDGRLSVNHNFDFKGSDERIKALLTIGFRMNVVDAFSTIVSNNKFSNDLGATVKYTWIGRGSAFFDTEKQRQKIKAAPGGDGPQKKEANRERAKILAELNANLSREAADLETQLAGMDPADLSKSDTLASAIEAQRKKYYKSLEEKYLKLFAEREAKFLENEESQNLVTTYWISVSAYIPVTTTTYNVATSFATNFSDQEIYPWELNLSYNRIFESRRYGRFFIYVSGNLIQNNAVKTSKLTKVDLNTYKSLGGTDTLSYALLESDKAYVGEYSNFITPTLKCQFVWFPPSWSIGLSLMGEQNMGKFNPLNGKIGIPVRLKGKGDDSFVNFELQARLSDITDTMEPDKSHSKKTTYGVSVGLPFSSILN